MFLLRFRPPPRSVGGHGGLDGDHPARTASVRVVPSPVGDEPTRPLAEGGSASTLHELLLAVASGDHEALAALERHIGGLVRVNIRRVMRDASQSDSVTQEYFAGIRGDVTDFDPDQGSALAWLLTRAHLRAISGLAILDAPGRLTNRPLHLVAGAAADLGHSGEPAA